MFEDYKIPIAFLILVLIIILGVKAQAQNIILFDDDDYTGFWTPANLPIDTTSTSVYFYGESPKTKVAKDSGGVSFRPYMWVIADSVGATADSTYGYTYTIPRPSDTTTYYYSQSVWWRQKDKDTIWLAAETDTVTVYPYIEPQPDNINYMGTVDGDTMFTAEGDTMKTSYNFNFNKTNGEKNEEDIILPQRVYAVLDSKRTMGFTV